MIPVDRIEVTFDAVIIVNEATRSIENPTIIGSPYFDPRFTQPPTNNGNSGFLENHQYDLGPSG